ncbi:MAG: CofH family radical SAM protein [Bacteroidales bacterium]|nr:CofH family radical SAM protein [Bacteroidales bacterium]MDD2424737.1 CofH family radical SAM protein [Bacteroidales bacterium]MDD3989304.1 CofH family radical SAM protein [Bacteroidales bacterium]MDD4639372.1 CofH family radical SAM protein [Bacteroidales bacterium]
MTSDLKREYARELYECNQMNRISSEATAIRERINGKLVWYNQNIHLEPSNVCRHRCAFCSFRREKDSDPGAWSMTLEEIRDFCKENFKSSMTEIHITGSVHPERDLDYYISIVKTVRDVLPARVAVKAYSAVEIDDMSLSSGKSAEEVLRMLRDAGLSALPGGGAEIFDPDIRRKIAPDKCSGERWLEIHKTAHKLGIRSNCTMLFGHIETRDQRVDHLIKLKNLQNETGGFDALIPLLFKNSGNSLSYIKELSLIEILKTFAVSRVVLDNISHIKSYWPMLGKEITALTLLYGADDIDGTINDSTKIFSLAGSCERNPSMSREELISIATESGYKAVERDSFYNIVNN